jgi:hypothetical protein
MHLIEKHIIKPSNELRVKMELQSMRILMVPLTF